MKPKELEHGSTSRTILLLHTRTLFLCSLSGYVVQLADRRKSPLETQSRHWNIELSDGVLGLGHSDVVHISAFQHIPPYIRAIFTIFMVNEPQVKKLKMFVLRPGIQVIVRFSTM